MVFVTLKKRREFQQISRSTERWVSPYFILQGIPRVDEEGPSSFNPLRVGFVITKKMGKAVVRNRIRRRLKAALQVLLKSSDFQKENLPSYDLVIVARRTCASMAFEVLLQQLRQGLQLFSPQSRRLKAASIQSKSCLHEKDPAVPF